MSGSVFKAGEVADRLRPFIQKWIDATLSKNANPGSDDAYLIELYKNTTGKIKRYSFTAAGMTGALAAAASGDGITLPIGTLTGNYTMIAGVKVIGKSRFATILTGQITGAAEASVENLSITRTANDGNALSGIVGQASGTFYVHACHIKCTQSGAGTAAGVRQDAAGTVEIWSTKLLSGSVGSSYGSYRTAGAIVIDGGATLGTTAAVYDP
jgi:hypothetical protein